MRSDQATQSLKENTSKRAADLIERLTVQHKTKLNYSTYQTNFLLILWGVGELIFVKRFSTKTQ